MPILLSVHAIAEVLERLPQDDAWLTPEERARLMVMRHPQRRGQFRAGHGCARHLLAQADGGDWREWALASGEHGEPLALREGRPSGWHVSIAHSSGLLACAVAQRRIGVDIECVARPRDVLALAASLHPEAFMAELMASEPDERRARFFRRWTLDEASAKADGRGLMREVLREQVWTPVEPDNADGWSWDLDAGWLALALTEPSREVIQLHTGGVPDGSTMQGWKRSAVRTTGHA